MKHKNQKGSASARDGRGGFMTLEVLLCSCLACVFVFGAVNLLFCNQQISVDAQNDAYSLRLAQAGMENALAQGFSFNPPADAQDNIFTEHLESVWLADYAKEIVSRASYSSLGKQNKTELNSLVTNWLDALGTDTCDLGFTGNWQNPQSRGSLSLGANNPATDVDAMDGKAYVATNGSVQSADDLFVVNVADVDHPSVIKSINTGPGLNALQAAGDYIYAANSSINGQLQIIKVADPANPTVMLNVKFAQAGSGGVASSIFYRSGKVYVGTFINSGPEFYVYNVENPLSPFYLGAFEVGSGVNKIYVYGDYAYLATGDVNKFRILNISDPAHITEIGDFSGVGGTAQSGESLAVLGGQAVFGRAGGLPGAHIPELYLLDVNQPGNIGNLNSADVNMSMNDIFLRGGLAFLATNQMGGQFQVYNYANNQLAAVSSANLNSDAVALDCEGENFFVAMSGDPALRIISPGD
jgi:hypothetical protein